MYFCMHIIRICLSLTFIVFGCVTILVLLKIVFIESHISGGFPDHLRDTSFSCWNVFLDHLRDHIFLLPIILFCWKDFLVAGCLFIVFASLLRRFIEGNVHVFLHARNQVVSFLSIFFSLSFASWIIIFLMRSFFQKLGVLPQRW